MSVVIVSHVEKFYGNQGNITQALNDISFAVEKQEFTAVMGASGSGKTTLLNVISTIDAVSAGNIEINGNSICELRENELAEFRKKELGFIFQEYNLLDTLTVGENIALPLNLKKAGAALTMRELKRVAETLGLTDQLQKFPYELSGGQRQRAACARALITDPALILADEPTGALDSHNSRILMETFTLMNQSLGSTILMVTHDAVVGSYASRVLFLKDGKIWSELDRGERDRQTMYSEILNVLSALGGDTDVR